MMFADLDQTFMIIKVVRKYSKRWLICLICLSVAAVMLFTVHQTANAGGPWYVSLAGNDSFDCLSSSTSCSSINGAISKAASGDTIFISAELFFGTAPEVVNIAKNVILSGGWESAFSTQTGYTTLDGENARRGVTIQSSVETTIERFIVQNGLLDNDGAGIHNSGILTLTNTSLRYNGSVGSGSGAGIYNDAGATATLTDFEIIYNGNSDTLCNGSSIHNQGTLTTNYGWISGNIAPQQLVCTDPAGYGSYSSNVFNTDTGILTISNSLISNNSPGGGITAFGALTLDSSVVSENTGREFLGGGVTLFHGEPKTIVNSTILRNTTDKGGGILLRTNDVVSIINSTISDNIAVPPDGWMCTGDGCAGSGGGIYSETNSEVTIKNSTITRNLAQTTPLGASDMGMGGGLFFDAGKLWVENTIISGNIAATGDDCASSLIIKSFGYNLFGDISNCFYEAGTGDQLNTNPKLFPIVGWPQYYPLDPASSAVDGGNPAGCTDHLSNPLINDQRGTNRHIDGDTNGSELCDIGSYELDPANQIQHVFLPLLSRYDCANLHDDFSDSSSGWPITDDDFVRSEYLSGEYRVLSKQTGYLYLFAAPACARENYIVEADVRWVGSPGNSYGLLFGILGNFDHYYIFEVNTDFQLYRLMRRDLTDWHIIVPETSSTSINTGTNTNHLVVIRNGEDITLEVNGNELGTWSDGNIQGRTFMGLVTSPYDSNPTSDARFDNYSVSYLPTGGSGFASLDSSIASSNKLTFYEDSHDRPSDHREKAVGLSFNAAE